MNCLNHFRNSFHLTIGMKRKTTDENDEFEGKRGRSISNGSNGYGNHSPNAQVNENIIIWSVINIEKD